MLISLFFLLFFFAHLSSAGDFFVIAVVENLFVRGIKAQR